MRAVLCLSMLVVLCCAAAMGAGPALQAGIVVGGGPTEAGGNPTMHHVTGPFDVTLSPQATGESDAKLGRMLINKQYHGALAAEAKGEMLTAMTETKGSAGYVAIERVSGTLDSRKGSFVLQHSSTMDRGAPVQSITVVPDSGTGELAAIRGTMTVLIAPGGKHTYDFAYTLAAKTP